MRLVHLSVIGLLASCGGSDAASVAADANGLAADAAGDANTTNGDAGVPKERLEDELRGLDPDALEMCGTLPRQAEVIGAAEIGTGTISAVLPHQVTIQAGANELIFYIPDVDVSAHFAVASEATISQGRSNSTSLDVLFTRLVGSDATVEGKSGLRGISAFQRQIGDNSDVLSFDLDGVQARILDIEETIRCRPSAETSEVLGMELYRVAIGSAGSLVLANNEQGVLAGSRYTSHHAASWYIFDPVLDALSTYRSEFYVTALTPAVP